MASWVNVSGPLFNGLAGKALTRFCQEWEREYAGKTGDAVRSRLDQVLKHPTGKYRRNIQTRRDSGHFDVNDNRMIYGPWLEGTGSRNAPVTRFKGYNTFRLISQRMQFEAGPYAENMLRPYIDLID